MRKKIIYLNLIIFLFIYISFIFFLSSLEAREILPARFSANAYTGVYTVGQADLMVSLDGDQQHNLYLDPQGAYGSDQQWYGDLGLGYRWIKNDAAILGAYFFAMPNTKNGIGNGLTLNNGQGIFSKIADYSAPAMGAARSIFNGGFSLFGNNQFDSVILNNTGVTSFGIVNGSAQNSIISNSQIGNVGNPYTLGIFLLAGSITVDNSSIFSSVTGINAINNSSLVLQSSMVNVDGVTPNAGVVLGNASNGVINNSQITVLGSMSSEGVVANGTKHSNY
jgi:hypothetical protein